MIKRLIILLSIINFNLFCQVKIDSCIVYNYFENHGIKAMGVLNEFKQIEQKRISCVKLDSTDCKKLSSMLHNSKIIKIFPGKLPANLMFFVYYDKGEKNYCITCPNFTLIHNATSMKDFSMNNPDDVTYLKNLYLKLSKIK